MNDKFLKQLSILKIYSIFLTIAIMVLFYIIIKNNKQKHFGEIDVERINVVEKNGDLKLVISNSEIQHMGMINGKELPARERAAGLIFFNSDGDECGGLIYDGNDEEAVLVLSVDKFKDDQVMQLQYMEDTKTDARKYGLQLWDYGLEDGFEQRMSYFNKLKAMTDPKEQSEAYKKMKEDGLLAEDRLFIGKKFNKDVGLFINDNKGNPRIKIYIDKENNTKFEFLDEKGNILP